MQKRTLSQMYGSKNATVTKRTLAEMYGKSVLTNPTGTKTKEKEQDVGGPLGGIGYVLEKLAVGLVSSFEGAVDYVQSGFAKLVGNDKWAEEIISEDWFGDWYSHPEEWYNPSDAWKFAGDVAGGIGTSLPALGIAIATHGAALPTFAAAALPAAGRSTQEAYEKTGELGIQEFGYGALSGGLEGGIETVFNLIGMGTGTVVKSFTKNFAKEATESAAKQGIIKTLGKSFIGEALEEGTTEFLDPYIKRATYDGQAKNATADEILYAGIVGGLAGTVMGGSGYAIDSGYSFRKGNKLVGNGGDAEVLDTSLYISKFAEENGIDEGLFSEIANTRKSLIESMIMTGNKVQSVTQKTKLGSLSRLNAQAAQSMFVAKRAQGIINNADVIANRLTEYGYKDSEGKAMTFTAEEITAGYDPSKPSSIYKALRKNSKLRTLAVADAAGALILDTSKFTHATLTGKALASKVDLNRFLETATKEEVAAVSEALKIDDWSALTPDSFAEKIGDYVAGGGVQQALHIKELKASFKTAEPSQAFKIPKLVVMNKDGVRRYTDGNIDIGISKEGEAYRVYNYKNDSLTKEMSKSDVNAILRSYNGEKLAVLEAQEAQLREYERLQAEAKEIDTYARGNIKEYKTLNAPNQSMIRKVIREGRANGINDSDVLMYAKIAAHSGLDIVFSKEANRRDTSSTAEGGPPSPTGKAKYADGFYEASKNRIVVNPESKRTGEALLIHELDHAIRTSYGGNAKFRIQNAEFEATKKKIDENYDKSKRNAEYFAYYSEKMLTNKHTLEKLIEAEPTLKEKILSFFKGASTDYADVPKLSGAAKRYYRTYKKLFDDFSARNAQNNAAENAHLSTLSVENAQKTPLTNINQGNMSVSGRQYAFTNSNSGTAHDSLLQYDDELRSIIENRGDTIIDNYDKLKSTVKNAFEKPDNKSTAFLGIIDTTTLQKIKDNIPNLPKELEGKLFKEGKQYSIAITMDSIRHMVDEKGLSETDIIDYIDKIADVIIDFDSVNFDYYIKGKNKTPGLLFKKSFSDGTIITFDLVSQNKRSLLMQTLYMESSDYQKKKSAKALPMQNASGKTSKTQVGQTSIVIIPENQKNVKGIDEKTSDKQFALPIDEESDSISGAEVMSWLKSKPESDGKIDLEATVARGLPYRRGKSNLTVGELRKVIANSTHEKVYSKKDALRVVNKFSGSSGLTVKAREEIADTIWQFLNEAPDIEYRADMAQDIAEFIVAKILVDSKTENPDALAAAETLSYLRTGIGKISFTDGDITELHHAVDDKGVKRLVGRWGYKGAHRVAGAESVSARRVPMDVYVTEIAREMPGMEHLEEMHPVEAFLEIDRAYDRAYADSKDKWISSYWDMPDSEIPSMIEGVRDAILEAYESEGSKSKFQKLVDEKISRYEKRAEYYKAERDEIKGRDRILGLLMNQASKMKDLKLGTYANATQHQSDVLRGSVERLSRIQFRGNLNVSGTRNIINELRLWYNRENGMLEYKSEQETGYYVQGIADRLNALADGEGGFTKADLTMLYDVMAYFTNFVENYGKVYRKGKWIEAEPEAKRYVNTMQTNRTMKVGILRRILGSKYMHTFGDPMTVARRMDMYESGFYTEMLEELREGAVGAQVAEMEVRERYDKFLTDNRKYIEKAGSEEITYLGVKVPKLHLIGIYMTLKRKHSRAGLAENGFAFDNLKGERVRAPGFAMSEKELSEAEIDKRAEEQLTEIAGKLTDTDMEYIKILEEAYNVKARKLKADRDMQRLGFTNAGMGYYYPIRRGNIAKNVDSSDYMAEMDRVTNSSFNKNTVRGARQELFIENADVVFRRHVRSVCQYSYLSPAIEAYNRLYNLDVSGNPNQPISVATEGAYIWDKGNDYFKKLISDIQGIPAVSAEGSEMLSRIRGGYAKFQLGANPKVWFTQGSSLFASTSRLDADSLIKGAGVSAEGMDKYCSLAKLRNSENTAAIAQAVLDTRAKKAGKAIDRVSDALMAPIGKVDRFVVGRLFGACQAQVEKEGGGKVGTEENKIAAGKLLEEVILETQQNSVATERSAAMRSGSEMMRALTMFTADSMKVVGRVIDGFGEVLTLRERIRRADGDAKAGLEKRLKSAEKKTKKALGAMVTSAIYMAAVAQLFRWLYDKEEEDENTLEVMAADVAGNLIGGLPLVKDVVSRIFLGGYELDNYAYSTVNDLIDAGARIKDISEKAFAGELEAEERNRAIRDMAYSVGQLTGLPYRNVYNAFFELTKRFSPGTAFKIDSAFYKKNYQTELNKAIAAGDNEMSEFILSLMLGERVSDGVPADAFNEILALTQRGQRVLPKSMPDTVTVGDVEYTLSETEREAMKEIYSDSTSALQKLFASSDYKALTDEGKALAIDHVYDTYYALASEAVLGTDGGNRAKVAEIVGADVLATLYVKTKGLTSDKDREGNTVAGSKRAKVVKAINSLGVSTEERLLLICASGYSLKDGDIRGVSASNAKRRLLKYILSLKGVSAAEKAEIAVMCGFEVRNGKIVKNLSLF